ncbi:MAG: alpha amylase C-terminal domain-containing protein [Endozoicomonas sp.]
MGSELAGHSEWEVGASLPWHLLEQGDGHKDVQELVRDLNVLYRTTPAMHELDQDHRGFRWLVLEDHQQSVFAFVRFDQAGEPLVIISNMTPVVRHNYRIGVPVAQAGLGDTWHELLNTDDVQYGGSGVCNEPLFVESIPSHEQQGSLSLTLPPLATVILKPVTGCNRLQ